MQRSTNFGKNAAALKIYLGLYTFLFWFQPRAELSAVIFVLIYFVYKLHPLCSHPVPQTPSNLQYSCNTDLLQSYLHPVSQTVVHLISTCITPFFELIRWYFWLMRPLWTTSVRLISTYPKNSYIEDGLRN